MKAKEHNKQEQEFELEERIVKINRVAKVVTGGRRFSLNALVVVGDKNGRVGYGTGKGKEVPDAIRKASKSAQRKMQPIARKGHTIPFKVEGKFCSAKVMLKPATEGTGIIAGAAVRAVMEAAGIQDVVTKSLGSDNQGNIVRATMVALKMLRTREDVERLRGVKIDEA